MKKNRIKRTLYLRIFGMFFGLYLVLMMGFSAFLVSEEKEKVGRELGAYSSIISNRTVDVLGDYLDENNQIIDISKARKGLVNNPINIFMLITDVPEIAIFTSDFQLLYGPNHYWRFIYTGDTKHFGEEDSYHGRYGLLNPNDWFSEEEIKEFESYLYANPKVEELGDLAGYELDIDGFRMEDGMVIPSKIYITSMYATSLNEEGDVISSRGTRRHDPIYESEYENIDGLPYFENGRILPENNNPNDENQKELRKMVLEQSRLERNIEQFYESATTAERANGLRYRYYMAVPYENSITVMSDGSLYSDYWTAVAVNINIGERISSTLLYVWTACLLIFFIAAYILSRQTFKTYLKQEELERQRKEMTDALAHDLKTPLSIISGYAQNLEENVQSEKREHYASHINKNVNRMDKIIGKMLEMSRLESNYFDLKLEEVSLDELSKKIINRYNQLCDEKSISISLEGDAFINADKSLIERVIDNFIINAIENTPEDGRISIKILDDTLEVYNSGSHISEDKIEEIWFPYKKVDVERSNTKGTGLGLSISRTILELHGFLYGAKNSEDGVIFWFKW